MNDSILNDTLVTIQNCLTYPYQITARENTNGSLSVLFFEKLALRLLINKKGLHVEILSDHLDDPDNPASFGLEFKSMSSGYMRFTLHSPKDIVLLSSSLNNAWKDAARSVESFGCCHAFMECSDARQCLYENDSGERGRWCWGCMYHWNLLNGRIFYGKNANNAPKQEENHDVCSC
ncbi:MAG: hypothetical protein Q4F18_11705 [Clostridia bacterium]|nr:hypothetical protein [Clostridia bacterium]